MSSSPASQCDKNEVVQSLHPVERRRLEFAQEQQFSNACPRLIVVMAKIILPNKGCAISHASISLAKKGS